MPDTSTTQNAVGGETDEKGGQPRAVLAGVGEAEIDGMSSRLGEPDGDELPNEALPQPVVRLDARDREVGEAAVLLGGVGGEVVAGRRVGLQLGHAERLRKFRVKSSAVAGFQ